MTVPLPVDDAKVEKAVSHLLDLADSNTSIVYADREALRKSLAVLIACGPERLHCIFDFDMTMTKYWVTKTDPETGKEVQARNYSSHSVISLSDRTSEAFSKGEANLFSTYYKIEVDPTMTAEQKIPFMVEWWTKSHELLVNEKLTRADFKLMASQCPVVWRDQLEPLLHSLEDNKVPILVFSAGVAATIKAVLDNAGLYLSNVHVASNQVVFDPSKPEDDPTALAISVKEPFIHVFNKGEFAIRDTPFYQTVCPPERDNVILIGDSIGDIHMKDGVEHSADLSVGLLNHDKEKHIEKYKQTFKIVFTDDLSLEWVLELVRITVDLHKEEN